MASDSMERSSDLLSPLSNFKEINQQWIEKILSQKLGSSVIVHSWSSRVPEGREGFLSEIAFLKVMYSSVSDIQRELHLVLKILPQDQEIKSFMANGGLARREVEFYGLVSCQEFQDICSANNIVLQLPDVYFSCYKEDAISIVMNDLSVNKCKSVIVKEGSNLSQTKVALQSIALVHAAGLIFLNKYGEDHEKLTVLASEFSTEFYSQYMNNNIRKLIEMTNGTSISSKIECLLPISDSMFTYHKRYPLIKTIVHGDLWAGQMLYSEDETSAFAIDWQFCRVDNPVLDVVAMFFMSCDPKVLERDMDELLNCYWESLCKPLQSAGVTLKVTYEHFKKNVEDLLIFGFAILLVSIHDFLGAGNLTEERLIGAMNFVESRGAFSSFFNLIGKGI